MQRQKKGFILGFYISTTEELILQENCLLNADAMPGQNKFTTKPVITNPAAIIFHKGRGSAKK